ncbi:MAG: hypothetical protein A2W61_01295 [Deltaproteobacteria bacterium RIFCSPLOWO2_01_44_7]|nr:MAG: hypothetical protein A2712_02395 [Deltaproteobacteria bacterium RIFCSPHIGHO2_01_FULL_43_49]OGQ15027.1 MAG: hypothetical protein A3D22_03085 [Deltaproteobacteria bacterium RIFCSPHIGHO2_02_FULL_44_53]OGQ27354.1 MAG: hypothetical protein A3D98_02990 [Deltaproteobacteria bacterium RIFCSPHIGHO2_12_FULL_44_21]OGQ31544.1 MAG: hypothetical protein A2979_04245 [Deltaproteobacteria bacterium RIFCSPLOWO2_01_FULL_45_74]OGQ39013.1 MAG: hypothetical protein A2W61_01295 [Deltaproteobacteria bacterium 
MHIVMIGARKLYPNTLGGLDFYVRELSEYLAQNGYTISLYCHRQNLESRCQLPTNIRLKPIWTYNRHHLDTFLYGLLASFKSIFEKTDFVHYHGGSALFCWIPKMVGKKIIVTLHSQEWFSPHISLFLRFFYYLGEWIGVKGADHLCCVSKTLRQSLQKRYKRDVVYIPLGLNIQSYSGREKLSSIGLKPKNYLLFMGRLEKGKGIELLFEAYKNFSWQSQYPLVIAGVPLYNHQYLMELKEKAPPNILFLGRIEGNFKKELLTNALLYVQASQAEGLSIALLEAMSYGCPTLVSNIEPNLEAIAEGSLFFKNSDPLDLQIQLEKLLCDPAHLEIMGQKAKRKIEQDYSWVRSQDFIAKLYNN